MEWSNIYIGHVGSLPLPSVFFFLVFPCCSTIEPADISKIKWITQLETTILILIIFCAPPDTAPYVLHRGTEQGMLFLISMTLGSFVEGFMVICLAHYSTR